MSRGPRRTADAVRAGDPERELARAKLLASQGRHEEAIPLFEKTGALQEAADAALAAGQHERASQFFRKAGAWRQAARCFEEAGKLRDALRVLEEGVSSFQGRLSRPGEAGPAAGRVEDLKILQAEILIRMGRNSSAAELLGSLAASPRIAALLEQSGFYVEAVQCLLDLGRVDEAARVAAKSPQRERLQAQIYLRTGRPVEAGDLFAQLGLAREAAEAYAAGQEWSRAAYRWEASGEPLRAAEAYEKAGRLFDAARCFGAAGMSQRAAEAYARARKVDQEPTAQARRSQAVETARKYLSVGDQARAASVLMQMQPADPSYGEGVVLLAPLLIEEDFCEEALERLRRMAPAGAESVPEPLALERDYWEARALEALGQIDAARVYYQRALAVAPGHRDVRQRLERLDSSTAPLAPPAPLPEEAVGVGPAPGGTPLAGRYELLAEIGRGGMGRVFKARDLELGELVAVKTLMAPDERGSADEARLLREVQICRRISHPNVVRVYDLGRFPGGLFVTMELLDGRSLDDVIENDTPLPFVRIRSILSEIAAGLYEAHSQGIIHRDLKPANVLVTASRVKILDFGIASMAGLGARLTHAGFVMGTPMYMSPDQILGHELDGRSDLYSLGVLAYALIAGREPFDSEDPRLLVLQHLREEPRDVRTWRPETPESWVALLGRLLAKSPEERFQSAQELLAALAQLPV